MLKDIIVDIVINSFSYRECKTKANDIINKTLDTSVQYNLCGYGVDSSLELMKKSEFSVYGNSDFFVLYLIGYLNYLAIDVYNIVYAIFSRKSMLNKVH